MSFIKKSVCFAIIFSSLLLVVILPSSASMYPTRIENISVSASAAVLIDAESGDVLYAKHTDKRLPMASTTKIMTALVALEAADISQTVIVSEKAVGVEGSSVYLTAGERLTLKELLYALLLESANDAAVAIAIAVAGDTDRFVALMNAKADELGLKNTHFDNPHGLDGKTHYTTAYDLAIITANALKNPHFSEIVATRKYTISMNGNEGVRFLVNHNRMLRSYDGAIGVKTGFTKKSGRCLVSAAMRDGLTLIAVTINAPDDWNDHRLMLDAGFNAVKRITLAETGDYHFPVSVVGGTVSEVLCTNGTKLTSLLPASHGPISCKLEAPRFIYAPAKAGDKVGMLTYTCDGEIICSSPLILTEDINQKPIKKTFWDWLRSLFGR